MARGSGRYGGVAPLPPDNRPWSSPVLPNGDINIAKGRMRGKNDDVATSSP